MKLDTLYYLCDNFEKIIAAITGLILAIISLLIVFTSDVETDSFLQSLGAAAFVWLLLFIPFFLFFGLLSSILFRIVLNKIALLETEKNVPGFIHVINSEKRERRRAFIKKIIKPILAGIILYLPCALLFNLVSLSEQTNLLHRSILATLLWLPIYIFSIALYASFKWLEKNNILKKPKITKNYFIIGVATYLICAVLLAVANPDRDLDSEYLSATTTIWVFLQLAMIFIYFIFKLTVRLFRSSH